MSALASGHDLPGVQLPSGQKMIDGRRSGVLRERMAYAAFEVRTALSSREPDLPTS